MSKSWTVVLSLAGFVLLAGFQNCGSQPSSSSAAAPGAVSPGGSVQMVGTVQKPTANQPLQDGCQTIICGLDSSSHQVCVVPVQWKNAAQYNNGDTVSIVGVRRDDMASICLAGDIVQVNSDARASN